MLNKKKIGETLSNARKSKGLTQRDIAARIKVSTTTISRIESGRFSGSISSLYYYANFLGYEITLVTMSTELPDWHELDTMFNDD